MLFSIIALVEFFQRMNLVAGKMQITHRGQMVSMTLWDWSHLLACQSQQ